MSARGCADRERGMSLVEVLVSLLLVVVVLFGILNFTSVAYRTTRRNLDKQFATQKAISMLEELKSLVQVQSDSASVLDAFDDGASVNAVLTTERAVTDPSDPISGNKRIRADRWKYSRQISVSLLPGTADPTVRLVTVRVYHTDEDGDGRPDVLAEIAGVLRTAAGNFPPTQVYDVYALAIENVPGWWVYMANLIPFMQSAIQNLQSRNPGLEFRVHWITQLAYGRDSEYRPQINSTVDSTQPIDNVYFYPGALPVSAPVRYYYPPSHLRGRLMLDSTEANGYDRDRNPHPYALADAYNHALRYPDELELFERRVASGQQSDDAPTLRILLERLYRNPERFRNAIFINLHGELFPFPPIRNYSDPAKEPLRFPSIRVVTHPERLRYPETATSVKLRVYSYRMDPDNASASRNRDWLGQGESSPVPITVVLKGVAWNPVPGSSDVLAIRGGTDQDAPPGPDSYEVVAAPTTPSASGMYYTAAVVGGDTVLSLYNSPLKAPEVSVSGSAHAGLNRQSRLYGLEYLPAPAEDFTGPSPPAPFGVNLASLHTVAGGACTGGACTPNTARWVITIPAGSLPGGAGGDGMLRIETRIGSTSSGTPMHQPPNLSATYLWRGSDRYLFGDGTPANPPHLPITEMYQIQGDPRHNPYADLKRPHQGSGLPGQDPLGMGYNRYFDDFEDGSVNAAGAPNWAGYTYTAGGRTYGVRNDGHPSNDSWKADGTFSVEIDMHRIYQILRVALSRSQSIYTTMTGYSFYYCGIGNEIGYDAENGFPKSIPISSKLFRGTNGTTFEQSILPDPGGGVKYIRENVSGQYWWGIHWLGELYPDETYGGPDGWAARGNLPTGMGLRRFVRESRANIDVRLPRGTRFLTTGRRTGPEGSTSFFWTGSPSSTFHHIPSEGTGRLLSGGQQIATRFNYPLSDGIPINRPFAYNLDRPGWNPDHFGQPVYGPLSRAYTLSRFYDHSDQPRTDGSALVAIADDTETANFVVVNGISMTGESGSSFIANWSMLTLVHGFLAAGRYSPSTYGNHVVQLPRISITAPNPTTDLSNPASILIRWKREWLRWDGQTYVPSAPAGYRESSPLVYAVLYSADNGASFRYVQDSSPATPGIRPSNPAHLVRSADSEPSIPWATPPGSFPRGTYLIRVEAYREDLPLHYAYHQYRAFVRRS